MGEGTPGGFSYDNVGNGNPNLYEEDVTLSAADQAKTLSSIAFTYDRGANTVNILAISGNPAGVPEPAPAALAGAAGLGLLARRRRRAATV